MKNILVTGSAGFIGSNMVLRLLKDMPEGTIIGLDNLNNYYDVSLKEYRLEMLDVRNLLNMAYSIQYRVGFPIWGSALLVIRGINR